MAMTLCELKWLSPLLYDLCVKVTRLILLHCDNQATLHIAANPVFHEHTKHIEIDYYFVSKMLFKLVLSSRGIFTVSSNLLMLS